MSAIYFHCFTRTNIQPQLNWIKYHEKKMEACGKEWSNLDSWCHEKYDWSLKNNFYPSTLFIQTSFTQTEEQTTLKKSVVESTSKRGRVNETTDLRQHPLGDSKKQSFLWCTNQNIEKLLNQTLCMFLFHQTNQSTNTKLCTFRPLHSHPNIMKM